MRKENKKKFFNEERFKSLLMAAVLSIASFNIGYYLDKNNNKIDNNKANKNNYSTMDTSNSIIEDDEDYDEYTEYKVEDLYLIDVSMCNNIEDYKDKKFCIAYKKLDSTKCEEHDNDDFTYVYRVWETYYDILRDNDIYFVNEFYSLNGRGTDLVPGSTSVDGNNGSMTFRNYDYGNIVDLSSILEYMNDSTLNSYVSEDGYITRDNLKELNKLLDILSNENNLKYCNNIIDNNNRLYRA